MDLNSQIREISGITALVSTTLVLLGIQQIGVAWKGLEKYFLTLPSPEKRPLLGIMIFTYFLPFISLLAANVVGFSYPELVPDITLIVIAIFISSYLVATLVAWFTRVLRRRPTAPVQKLNLLSLYYLSAFLFITSSILFSLLALLGVGGVMLDIRIGPYWFDNYSWGRWSLWDGMFFFVVGTPMLGIAYVSEKLQSKPKTD